MDSATALIVIDVQQGFLDANWGASANLEAENRVAQLSQTWQSRDLGPIVMVQHNSANPGSPLHPDNPGNALMAQIADVVPDVRITKQVNSAFYGEPSLQAWLDERGIRNLVICGIQTNMCVETTARMAGNLGYTVSVPLDATRTFDIDTVTADGTVIHLSAEDLMRATAASLQGGGFATVTTTAALLDSL